MDHIDNVRDKLPEAAKDIKLNLVSVLEQSTLDVDQRWGTAVACAFACRQRELVHAIVSEARPLVKEEILDDARAAAVLMGMNNVLYRGRHFLGKDVYEHKPAKLRMNRIVQPASSKANLELFSLAVSAINGCEVCMKAHEKTSLAGGLSEDQVFDALRIASVIHATAVALDIAAV